MPKWYDPTVQDVRRAIEYHGREISLTKLAEILNEVAVQKGYDIVGWKFMKERVHEMLSSGQLMAVQIAGHYQYKING